MKLVVLHNFDFPNLQYFMLHRQLEYLIPIELEEIRHYAPQEVLSF